MLFNVNLFMLYKRVEYFAMKLIANNFENRVKNANVGLFLYIINLNLYASSRFLESLLKIIQCKYIYTLQKSKMVCNKSYCTLI